MGSDPTFLVRLVEGDREHVRSLDHGGVADPLTPETASECARVYSRTLAHACVLGLVSVVGRLDLALKHQVQESRRSQPDSEGSYGFAR